MKILIKVTKDILEESAMCPFPHESTGTNCAIAVAIREIFPHARVREDRINTNGVCIPLPEEAQLFIYSFDRSSSSDRINMPELSFEINVPSEVIDKIGIGQVYKVLSESRTLELVHP